MEAERKTYRNAEKHIIKYTNNMNNELMIIK